MAGSSPIRARGAGASTRVATPGAPCDRCQTVRRARTSGTTLHGPLRLFRERRYVTSGDGDDDVGVSPPADGQAELPPRDPPADGGQALAAAPVEATDPGGAPGTFIGPRGPRWRVESVFVRLVATSGIVGICVALAAILGTQDVAYWIVGLIVALVSVVVAAILWSSRTL